MNIEKPNHLFETKSVQQLAYIDKQHLSITFLHVFMLLFLKSISIQAEKDSRPSESL